MLDGSPPAIDAKSVVQDAQYGMTPSASEDAARLPKSATHGLVGAAGFVAFVLASAFVRLGRPFGNDVVHSAIFIIGATTAAIFLVDLAWQKIHLRSSAGLDFAHDDPSWGRTLTKLAGLLACLGLIALGYWLLPQYREKYYENYFEFLRYVLPPWIVLGVPYFFWVDRKMREPRDGYWHMGKVVAFQWDAIDGRAVRQLLLAWIIKGYFAALMITYLCEDLKVLLLFNFDDLASFKGWFDFLYRFLFSIDVGLAALGYVMSFRLTDTHIRSADPTALGWVVTLACYEPFWGLVRGYLAYYTGYAWDAWLAYRPLLYIVWGSTILILVAIYLWATVSFGARFSNLTHRGVITNGPYRWTKHPAYLAKSLTMWLMAVPFMPRGTPGDAVQRCLLLLGVNFIYVMRAKTEEWHLSRDPEYVQYALWMEEHGLLRFLKHLPLLRQLTYRRPRERIAAL